MSEPSPSEPMVEDPPVNGHNEDDKSQLSEDLLNTLRKLQESTTPSTTTPALPTPTQSTAQETQETVKMQESTPPPLSEWDQLRAQLREKPVDADRWLKLVALAEASRDLEKIKETYEGMLEVYPNVPSVHIAYLNHFLDDPAHYPHAEALFKRFLAKSASSVEVFKVYLGYIRRIKREREVVQQCYQFALANAGQDKDSYEIWQEFINHLKAGEVRNVRQSAPSPRILCRALRSRDLVSAMASLLSAFSSWLSLAVHHDSFALARSDSVT